MEMMKFSVQAEQPQSQASDSGATYQADNQSTVVPAKFIATFEKKEHSWFALSQIPTDLSIQVEDITFYVHKCGYFGRTELQPPKSNLSYDHKIDNFPGGAETFEIILKFCYGLPISLTANNVAVLRCAAEFLEMTEALEDGNLISKAEAFFTFVVLSSWRDSITVLRSCETLSPWAENLQIVRRCCDSIAWKISHETSTIGEIINGEKWWFNDMATLRIDYFTRIVTALKAKGVIPEIIGSCIMQYGEIWLPITESGREGMGSNNNATLVSELEKRVGMVLDTADVSDLLIPNYAAGDQGKLVNSSEEHMYNIDVVQRILEYFLLYEQKQQQQQPGPLTIITKFQVLAQSLPENARTCDDGLYRAIDIYLKAHPSLTDHEGGDYAKS
ncbi:UNVERIFIED_CONTAM: BTB/POZ domain-containing protein DOT3 [Sesamum radiatum]|uniref:BTB/POZ domain-containing protein DOT3 n=1 Tax=Sesamum radiatum TaxID=300843 RepID=A0AAW2RET5_SESRA